MTNGGGDVLPCALPRALPRRWLGVRCTVVASFLFLAPHGVGAFEAWPPQAEWHIERGVVAPWAPAKTSLRQPDLGAMTPAQVASGMHSKSWG